VSLVITRYQTHTNLILIYRGRKYSKLQVAMQAPLQRADQ
ncbi:hypothetical protein CCACVL1_00707, partial [Corchorus capsularis]